MSTASAILSEPVSWHDGIPRGTGWQKAFGFFVIIMTVVGFGFWAATAPIAGAVVSTGSFVATGKNKIVQHLEGGLIDEILVHEGDQVKAGDVLVRLDATAPRAEVRRLTLQLVRLEAIRSRLASEAQLADGVTFPEELLAKAKADTDVADIVESQKLAFDAARKSYLGEVAVLEDNINALKARINGSKVQLENTHAQLTLIKDELGVKDKLLAKGLVDRTQVLALQRAEASLMGETGRLGADIGDATERMARVHEEIRGTQSRFVKSAIENLQQVGADILDLRERLRAAEDIYQRLEIRAPVAGTVLRLRFHTGGGVIEAGKPILDLLPHDEDLVIEAAVQPKDIDVVKVGQKSTIRLTGLNQRTTPMMEGDVIYISADSLRDESGQKGDQYLVRIKLDPITDLAMSGFQPVPGMPAEVLIKTTDRTLLEYLFQPIRDSMARSFRET